jgi:hypothetical protein
MWIDPFRLCVALVPLVSYLLLLGLVNLWRRPLLTTGARDLAALAIGVSGLIIVGPLELWMPEAAAATFNVYVWLLLIAFYGLVVTFLVLLARPRLVIYNIDVPQLRPILARVIEKLDADARWAGDSLALPTLGVQLHLDNFPIMRNVSLVASGPQQSLEGWNQLEESLGQALRSTEVPRNFGALGLVGIATLLGAGTLFYMLSDPQAVAQGWREMLWR